jgi:formylglycine-generating enzyme required for sulfatase activity
LKPFCIDQTEVSNLQFLEYIKETRGEEAAERASSSQTLSKIEILIPHLF